MKGERGQAEDNIGFATNSFVDVHLEKQNVVICSIFVLFLKVLHQSGFKPTLLWEDSEEL